MFNNFKKDEEHLLKNYYLLDKHTHSTTYDDVMFEWYVPNIISMV